MGEEREENMEEKKREGDVDEEKEQKPTVQTVETGVDGKVSVSGSVLFIAPSNLQQCSGGVNISSEQ